MGMLVVLEYDFSNDVWGSGRDKFKINNPSFKYTVLNKDNKSYEDLLEEYRDIARAKAAYKQMDEWGDFINNSR